MIWDLTELKKKKKPDRDTPSRHYSCIQSVGTSIIPTEEVSDVSQQRSSERLSAPSVGGRTSDLLVGETVNHWSVLVTLHAVRADGAAWGSWLETRAWCWTPSSIFRPHYPHCRLSLMDFVSLFLLLSITCLSFINGNFSAGEGKIGIRRGEGWMMGGQISVALIVSSSLLFSDVFVFQTPPRDSSIFR